MALLAYVARRLLLLIPVFLGVTLVTFSLTWVATQGHLERGYVNEKMSDQQVQQLIKQKGFDQPFFVQYFKYVERLVQGDWGKTKVPVGGNDNIGAVIGVKLPATMELTVVAMIFAVTVGIPLGIFSATRRDTVVDHASRLLALSGVSIPIFWLGLMLKMALSTNTGLPLLPLGGRMSVDLQFGYVPGPTNLLLVDTAMAGDIDRFVDALWHLILPGLTLGYATMAVITRMMRSSMLEVVRQDYIKTAWAKGLSEHAVIHKHAKANAMIPTLTVMGLAFGGLLGGAVLTETIFQWPGLGEWSTNAIRNVDPNAVLSFTVLVAIIYVFANLVVDLLYAYMDPRVRLG